MLLILFIFCDLLKADNCLILGSTIDFRSVSIQESACDYDTTCSSIICNILSNKTLSNMGLAFVALFTYDVITCKTIPFISKTKMITFIINNEEKFITPIACYNVGECFSKNCILINADKNNSGIGFMGQCGV